MTPAIISGGIDTRTVCIGTGIKVPYKAAVAMAISCIPKTNNKNRMGNNERLDEGRKLLASQFICLKREDNKTRISDSFCQGFQKSPHTVVTAEVSVFVKIVKLQEKPVPSQIEIQIQVWPFRIKNLVSVWMKRRGLLPDGQSSSTFTLQLMRHQCSLLLGLISAAAQKLRFLVAFVP